MLQVIWVLRWILYDAYVESNRPLPRTGLKQWSAKLTDAQRATLVALPTSGDPAPVIAALEDVLGKLPAQLPGPVLQDVVVPPEGVIRGLEHRLRARWDLGAQRGGGVLCTSLVPDGRRFTVVTGSSVSLAPTTPGSCCTNWHSKRTGGARQRRRRTGAGA